MRQAPRLPPSVPFQDEVIGLLTKPDGLVDAHAQPLFVAASVQLGLATALGPLLGLRLQMSNFPYERFERTSSLRPTVVAG